MTDLLGLRARGEDGHVYAVIESPRGSTAKLKYDADLGVFLLARPLVLGVAYPYDWGFFPSTRAPDGDPLDALVVHDTPTYPGVVIACRPVAVLKITQRRKHGRGRERNDRVIAVPAREPRSARGLPKRVRDELEQFFLAAVVLEAKDLHIIGWDGAKAADRVIRAAQRTYEDHSSR